jgi:hypothetical protein
MRSMRNRHLNRMTNLSSRRMQSPDWRNRNDIQADTITDQPQQQVADLNQSSTQATTSLESQLSTRVMQFL